MQLSVRDISKYFTVSEKTVLRWIKQEGMPATCAAGQYHFNRAEVLEWAREHNHEVSPDILKDDEEGEPLPLLSEALEIGGVFHKIPGQDKETVLRAVVNTIRLPEGAKPEFLFQLLMAREDLGSTGLGGGIAVPHVRNPIVLNTRKPSLTLCYLEKPVDYGAIDQQKVGILFTIISPTVKGHLHLLSRLSFVLHDEMFKAALKREAPAEEILGEVRRVEASLPR